MAILTGVVIAALIITAVYVGYHAYEASLHEEVEAHFISEEVKTFQSETVQILTDSRFDFAGTIL